MDSIQHKADYTYSTLRNAGKRRSLIFLTGKLIKSYHIDPLADVCRINIDMEGKWADLACINEVGSFVMSMTYLAEFLQHGSIAVQQVFEVFGSPELMVSSDTIHEFELTCFDRIHASKR